MSAASPLLPKPLTPTPSPRDHPESNLLAVTGGPRFHFFGYYDRSPFDSTGRYLLAHSVEPSDAFPTAASQAVLEVWDLQGHNPPREIGRTTAWNWQMGSQLQWIRGKDGQPAIVFNIRRDDRFASQLVRADGQPIATLDWPISAISPDGRWAASLDFSRMSVTHPTVGYANQHHTIPPSGAEDGLRIIDMLTGEARLVVTLEQMKQWVAPIGDEMIQLVHAHGVQPYGRPYRVSTSLYHAG
ncbi:MAG: hypothetical protein WD042_17350 [Phycisphaeraceae bacterium]